MQQRRKLNLKYCKRGKRRQIISFIQDRILERTDSEMNLEEEFDYNVLCLINTLISC